MKAGKKKKEPMLMGMGRNWNPRVLLGAKHRTAACLCILLVGTEARERSVDPDENMRS